MKRTGPYGPLAWPWPADTVLDRSRRVGRAFRDALAQQDPETAATIERWAADHGERWVSGDTAVYEDNDLLTLDEVARARGVLLSTVYKWRQRGLRYTPTVDGRRVKWADLMAFEQKRRLDRLHTR